jgi:hypothetical protein
MVLQSSAIQKFASVFSKTKKLDDIIFLDYSKDNAHAFFSTDTMAIRLSLPVEEILEDEKKAYALSYKTLMHIISSTSSFKLDANYGYCSAILSGSIDHNDSYLPELETVQFSFNDLSPITDSFTLTENLIPIFEKAIKYTDRESKLAQAQFIYIKNNKLVSSSNFRIYEYDLPFEGEFIIPADVAMFFIELGAGTKVSKTEKGEFLLEKDSIQIIFNAYSSPSMLPFFDDTHPVIKILDEVKKDGIKVEFDPNECREAITYMDFFARSVINNKTLFSSVGQEVSLSVNQNKYLFTQTKLDMELSFNFNLKHLSDIIKEVFPKKSTGMLTLLIHPTHNIFIVGISDNENVYLTKVNN